MRAMTAENVVNLTQTQASASFRNNPVFADVLHNLPKRRCRGLFQYVIT